MTAYALNKVCWLAGRDPVFRQRLMVDPERTLATFEPPLAPAAIRAFLDGDVAALCAMGAHRYLLSALGRQRLFGLDSATYVARLQAAYDADPEGRRDIIG